MVVILDVKAASVYHPPKVYPDLEGAANVIVPESAV